MNRPIPHNVGAEQFVIGVCVTWPDMFPAASSLAPLDFYLPHHREAWEAITALAQREGATCDALAVADLLSLRGVRTMGDADPHSFLIRCAQSVSTSALLPHYVAMVARDSARRKMLELSATIADRARETDDVSALTSEVRLALEGISTVDANGPERVGEAIDRVVDAIMSRKDNDESAIPTGIGSWDRQFGPLRAGRLHVIAARPGIGKSSLMRAFALHSAMRKAIPTLIFSLEVTRDELIEQFLSSEARVPGEQIDRGEVDQEGFNRILDARKRMKGAPLYVDERVLNAAQICAVARAWREKQDAPLVQVWIDYLGLVRPADGSSKQQREERVSADAWAFKTLAKDLKSPVGLVVQLNREIEKRGPDADPKLSDLRESGAIEQHAHLIAFVTREPPLEDSGPARIVVGKNRRGPTGVAHVQWLAPYATFVEAASDRDPKDDGRGGYDDR